MLPAGDQDEVELVNWLTGHQQAASSVDYTTSCKHSLVFLRMGEIIARNMLSWLKLLNQLLLLHLVGCLYYSFLNIWSTQLVKKFLDSKEPESSLSYSQKPSIGLHPEQFVSKSVLVLKRNPMDPSKGTKVKLKLFYSICRSSISSHCGTLSVTSVAIRADTDVSNESATFICET